MDVLSPPPASPPAVSYEYIEGCLLLALVERPAYGYELKTSLEELGLDNLDRGRIYRTLRAMESEGLVVSHWDTAGRGPARRTYELAAPGEVRLRALVLSVRRQRRQLTRFLARVERAQTARSHAVA